MYFSDPLTCISRGCVMYNCIWALVVYRGVRLGRVFVMDDVSNRVYSGPPALYILNPIDPFLFLANKKISCAIQGFFLATSIFFSKGWFDSTTWKVDCPQNKLVLFKTNECCYSLDCSLLQLFHHISSSPKLCIENLLVFKDSLLV